MFTSCVLYILAENVKVSVMAASEKARVAREHGKKRATAIKEGSKSKGSHFPSDLGPNKL